jgi:hypothetical protein
MAALGLFLCLVFLSAPALAQSANFEAVRVKQLVKGGESGLELECRLTIEGLKGKPCELNVMFFDPQGQPLKDLDQKYFNGNGEVAAAVAFTVAHDNALIDTLDAPDYRIFIPLSQMHLAPGSHALRARMAVYNQEGKTNVGLSNMATFVVNQP